MGGDKQQADAVHTRFRTFRTTASVTPATGWIAITGASPPDSASSIPTRNGTNLKATVTTRLSASNTIACASVGLRSPSSQRSVRKISKTASA